MGMKAVGYIRVSSATQLDGYGLVTQEADIKKAARTRGLKLTQVHRDEGVSGSLEAALRPGLAEALARIESGEAEVLLVPRLDRLARRLTIQEAALAQVWRHGGVVIAADQGEVARDDPDDPMRTAMRQMMGVFAQLERSMIVARLRRGREMKRASGGYAAGRPPYGYRADDGSRGRPRGAASRQAREAAEEAGALVPSDRRPSPLRRPAPEERRALAPADGVAAGEQQGQRSALIEAGSQ